MTSDSMSADPIGKIAEQFVQEHRAGNEPRVEDFAQQFPEHADEIREFLPTLLIMEKAKAYEQAGESDSELVAGDPGMVGRELGDYRIIREIGRGGMGVVYEAEQVSLGRRVALKVLPQQYLLDAKQRSRFQREARSAAKLHHTNIVPVFGVGSHEGISYFVMQYIHGLGLDEVLDEIKRLRSTGKQSVLKSESMQSANLSVHALAVSVHSGHYADPDHSGENQSHQESGGAESSSVAKRISDSNATDSKNQLVSEMLSMPGSSTTGSAGRESSDHDSSGKNSYWNSVARIGIQVADALHYAHQQGVTHRDIKPGNLLLDLGNTVWVTDFGLAKADDQKNLTHTGDILGTLRYMQPEGLEGKSDCRSDVYSLGVTLYELITFNAAIDESDRHVLARRICEGDIRKIPSDVPKDLATIVHKAIERDADDRYQTAQLLQEDLHRFVNDEAIRARSPSATERLLRWSRRNKPLAASLAGVVSLLLFIALAMSVATVYYRTQQRTQLRLYERSQSLGKQNERLLVENRQALSEAVKTGDKLNLTMYYAQMAIAHQAISQHRGLARTLDLLNAWKPANGEQDLRGWEWYYINSLCHGEKFAFRGHTDTVNGLHWSKDDAYVASASDDGTVKIWDVAERKIRTTLRGEFGAAICTAFNDDGKLLAAGGDNGLAVWDLESGELLLRKALGRRVFGVAWNATQDRLAAAIKSEFSKLPGEVQIFDTLGWTRWGTIERTSIGEYNATISWNPSGKLLAIPSRNHVVIWDLEKVKRVQRLNGHTEPVQGVAFNPNGKDYLASASRDATIKIWNLLTRGVHAECIGHTHGVASVAWHPAGKTLASASWDGTARIWDSDSGQEIAKFNCHPRHCFAITWNHSGTELATAGDDHLIKLWDPEKDNDARTIDATPESTVVDVDVSPRGDNVLCRSAAGKLSIWDTQSNENLGRFDDATDVTIDACYDNAGDRLFCVSKDSAVIIRDLSTGKQTKTLESTDHNLRSIMRVGENRVGAIGRNGPLVIWDAQAGNVVKTIGEQIKSVTCVSCSPNRRHVAIGTKTGLIHVIDLSTDSHTSWPAHQNEWVEGICWNSTGTLMASSGGHDARIWEVASGEEIAALPGHHEVIRAIDWSPNDRRLLTADARGTIVVWDPNARQKTLVLNGPLGKLNSANWSTDGLRIISSSDHRILVWDAEAGFKATNSAFPYSSRTDTKTQHESISTP